MYRLQRAGRAAPHACSVHHKSGRPADALWQRLRAARERSWARSAPPGTSTSRSTDVVSCPRNSDRRCPHVWWIEQTPPRVCSVHHTCGRPLVAPPHRPRALLGALRTAGGVDAPRSTDTTRSTDIRFCIVKTQRRSVTTISRAAADLAIALGARRLQCADQTAIGRDLQK